MPKEKKNSELELNAANVERVADFNNRLHRRILTIAERYFRKRDGWEPEKLKIDGEVRAYSESKVRVTAYDGGSYADDVHIPITLILDKNWETLVKEWAAAEKAAVDDRRQWREIHAMKEFMKKYPNEAKSALEEKK
jgi:hypothetical protein